MNKIKLIKNIQCSITILYIFSLILVSLIFCNSAIIIKNLNLNISIESGHYLYSALLQANAAILSIIGVFAIFKIQSLQSIIDTLKASRLPDPGISTTPTGVINFDKMTLVEKANHISTASINVTIKGVFESWLEKEIEIKKIIGIVKSPIIMLGCSIIAFALLIILIDTIYNLGTIAVLKTHIGMLYVEFIILVEIIRKILNIIRVD